MNLPYTNKHPFTWSVRLCLQNIDKSFFSFRLQRPLHNCSKITLPSLFMNLMLHYLWMLQSLFLLSAQQLYNYTSEYAFTINGFCISSELSGAEINLKQSQDLTMLLKKEVYFSTSTCFCLHQSIWLLLKILVT